MIDQPLAAAQAWSARSGVIPINHMVAVKAELVERHPEAVAEVYRMLVESRRAAGEIPAAGERDLQPFGFDALELSLRKVIDYAFDQQMIRRRFTTDELYGDVRKFLK